MTPLLIGKMPILVMSEDEQLVASLFDLSRNDPYLVMLGGFYCDRLLSVAGLKDASSIKDLTTLRSETVSITQSLSIKMSSYLQQQQILLCKQLDQIKLMKEA